MTFLFVSASSSSALTLVINRSLYNGSCSIDPSNGTTSTVFTLFRPHWFDENEIKDYSIQGTHQRLSLSLSPSVAAWTGDDESVDPGRLLIGYSSLSRLSIRLPSTDRRRASTVHLHVLIRDLLDCVTEVNISSVLVSLDIVAIDRLITAIHRSFPTSTLSQTNSSVHRPSFDFRPTSHFDLS